MADTIYPLDDTAMTYDYTNHRYVLNASYVINDLAEDLLGELDPQNDNKRSDLANRFLDRVSRILYNYIYSQVRNDAKDYVEFMLAKRSEWRDAIQQALEEQLYFMLRNSDLTTYNGINLYKGTKLEIKREDTISPQARDILENTNVLYSGFYVIPLNFETIKRSDY